MKTVALSSLVVLMSITLTGCISGEHKPSDLQGLWITKSLVIEGEEISVQEDSLTLIIDDNGVSGFSGCNNFFSQAQIDPDTFAVSEPIVTTKMACKSEAAQSIETEYLQSLVAVNSWKLKGNELFLTGAHSGITFHRG